MSNRVPEKVFGRSPKPFLSTVKGTAAETMNGTSEFMVGLSGRKTSSWYDFGEGFQAG